MCELMCNVVVEEEIPHVSSPYSQSKTLSTLGSCSFFPWWWKMYENMSVTGSVVPLEYTLHQHIINQGRKKRLPEEIKTDFSMEKHVHITKMLSCEF